MIAGDAAARAALLYDAVIDATTRHTVLCHCPGCGRHAVARHGEEPLIHHRGDCAFGGAFPNVVIAAPLAEAAP